MSKSVLDMAVELLSKAYHKNVFIDSIDPELRKLLETKYKDQTPDYFKLSMTIYKWELDNAPKRAYRDKETAKQLEELCESIKQLEFIKGE